MPDAGEHNPPSAAIDHEALLASFDLYRSTERLADCLGVSVACYQGPLTAGRGEHRNLHAGYGGNWFRRANHHLALLDRLCEQLHIQSSSVAHAAPRGVRVYALSTQSREHPMSEEAITMEQTLASAKREKKRKAAKKRRTCAIPISMADASGTSAMAITSAVSVRGNWWPCCRAWCRWPQWPDSSLLAHKASSCRSW